MSSPVSIQDGLFTTNTLASKKFLLVYILIIWGSLLPVLIEIFLFWTLFKDFIILFYYLFPFIICFGFLTLIITSTLLSKLALIITKILHEPKQGIFRMEKTNKNYYYWSLRAVIKKFPVWIANIIPSPFIHNLILKILGIKTNHSNSISNGSIDTEFVELGSKIIIGQGCSIRSSMIIKGHLIINKISIGDNVIIGSNSFIAPGTHIGSNTTLGAMSVTKINQNLESNMIYNGNPVEKLRYSQQDQMKILEEMEFINQSNQIYNRLPTNSEEKFVKNLNLNIVTFGIIYFLSNIVPILGIIYYFQEYFLPIYLLKPTIIHVFIDLHALLIFLITPLLIIILIFVNLFVVILLTKLMYKLSQYKNSAKEGIYHWSNKTPDFNNYFIRSFFLRYAKWKIQKSPFPWLMKPAFNFIGNCQFGKDSVIENCFIAKEFLKVGRNSYLGKALFANHLWDKNLTIKRIIIGDNVAISDNSCIAPGTEIENNVTVLPLSVTSKNEKLSPNSVYNYISNIGDNNTD